MTFAGSPDRIEARLVPEAGYELDTFRISGLPRRPSLELVRAVLLAGRAPRACALMEADAHLGLANRLAAPFARRIFLSFPIPGRDGAKYRVTGRPIPASSRSLPQRAARELFGLPPSGPVLLVFGGSLGAHLLNELAIDVFGEVGPAVLHLSGTRDYDELRPRVSRPDYRLFAFTEEFGAALGASDLALARAGGSVWELAAAGKPAVLVPGLFATGDHQTKNARYFEARGGAVVVPEDEVSRAPEVIRSLLDDEQRLAEMSSAMLKLARPDAADEIAEELLALTA